MDSLMAKDGEKREKGERVLKAFAKQVSVNRKYRPANEGLNADLRIGFPKLPRIIEESDINHEKVKEILRKKK